MKTTVANRVSAKCEPGLRGARFEIQETALAREETAGRTPRGYRSGRVPAPPSVDKIARNARIRVKLAVPRKRLGCSGLGGGAERTRTACLPRSPVQTGLLGECRL